jgi:hypothetical protein
MVLSCGRWRLCYLRHLARGSCCPCISPRRRLGRSPGCACGDCVLLVGPLCVVHCQPHRPWEPLSLRLWPLLPWLLLSVPPPLSLLHSSPRAWETPPLRLWPLRPLQGHLDGACRSPRDHPDCRAATQGRAPASCGRTTACVPFSIGSHSRRPPSGHHHSSSWHHSLLRSRPWSLRRLYYSHSASSAGIQHHGGDTTCPHQVDRRLGCLLPHHPDASLLLSDPHLLIRLRSWLVMDLVFLSPPWVVLLVPFVFPMSPLLLR